MSDFEKHTFKLTLYHPPILKEMSQYQTFNDKNQVINIFNNVDRF